MPKTDRSLSSAFIEFMNLRAAWPAKKRFEGWMRDDSVDRGGIRNGIYAAMKEGKRVDVRHTLGLVQFLRQSLWKPGSEALAEFCRIHGIADDASDASVAEHLLAQDEEDYFEKGIHGLLDVIRGEKLIKKSVQGCQDERQVRDTIRWVYVTFARLLESDQPAASKDFDQAIALATAKLATTLEAYQENALRWWNFDRWTVVRIRGKRGPTGFSIVLPLSQQAYESVRRGERSIHEIDVSELRRPSRYVLIEAAAEIPPDMGGETGNPSRNALIAHFTQCAILTNCHGEEANVPRHALTYAATEQGTKRAHAFGYRPTGNRTPGSGAEVLEKVYQWNSYEDLLVLTFLKAIGYYADRFLFPPK